MIPVVAIVGRPNVGKSTLFNALTRTRDALVADEPGVTRDRQYGVARGAERAFVVVDTGGLSDDPDVVAQLISGQAGQAIEEANVVVFLVDGREGLSAIDENIATRLRRTGKPVVLTVNKCEGLERATATAEFHRLALGEPLAVSSAHRQGLAALFEAVCAHFVPLPSAQDGTPADSDTGIVRIAIVGRPNVGKSTLINRLTNSERVVAHDLPGTTRDSILVPLERHGRRYDLVDTAGVRRRSKVDQKIEKFSVIKTLQAIDAAEVVLLLLDGSEGVTDQDANLIGHVLEAGRGLVVAVNKWDGLDEHVRERVRAELKRRLAFIEFARTHFISALHGSGVGDLFASIDDAARSASANMSTPALTRILQAAVAQHSPPLRHGRRIKLRYAHQGGSNPPVVVIHGTQAEALPPAYQRYLERVFREAMKMSGTPLRIELRSGANPFAGRRNTLTPTQQRKRKRLIRHVKTRR